MNCMAIDLQDCSGGSTAPGTCNPPPYPPAHLHTQITQGGQKVCNDKKMCSVYHAKKCVTQNTPRKKVCLYIYAQNGPANCLVHLKRPPAARIDYCIQNNHARSARSVTVSKTTSRGARRLKKVYRGKRYCFLLFGRLCSKDIIGVISSSPDPKGNHGTTNNLKNGILGVQ